MAKLTLFVSATIVGIFVSSKVLASPSAELANPTESEQGEPATPLDSNMALTPPPAVTEKGPPPDPHYYPYHQAFTVRSGYDSDFPKLSFNNWVLGFQYLFPKFLSPKLEAGADLIDNGTGHLHAGVRYYYHEKSYFRPSAKISLDHLAESENGLATLTKFENYFARGSVTLEYVVANPYSLRLEGELLINFKKTHTFIVLGLSRGW